MGFRGWFFSNDFFRCKKAVSVLKERDEGRLFCCSLLLLCFCCLMLEILIRIILALVYHVVHHLLFLVSRKSM